ncbi:MAG: ATP-binding cassette domain-containing protein [Alphaproteobacteria bacterium]|jgi:heme exporter protein A|nr:ATP-binding cassette domain-containing protein [Alphaproteobacteria bacterium]
MHSDTPFISLEALKIKRGGRLLAHGIQMCVKSGMVVWLKGTNGAGKTTLLETLAGLLPGAGGDRRQTCYIPAAPLAWQPFCVGELVRHWQALYPGAAPDAAHPLAALVDRTAWQDRAFKRLSSGQQQRLALQELLYKAAPVWLLDEPFASLDAAAAEQLSSAIRFHAAHGGAVVLTSHQEIDCSTVQLNLNDFKVQQAFIQQNEAMW